VSYRHQREKRAAEQSPLTVARSLKTYRMVVELAWRFSPFFVHGLLAACNHRIRYEHETPVVSVVVPAFSAPCEFLPPGPARKCLSARTGPGHFLRCHQRRRPVVRHSARAQGGWD
jgi:hypothetical protein